MSPSPSHKIGQPKENITYVERQAIRLIIKNDRNQIALIFIPKAASYKLPGGGIDSPDEAHHIAGAREALEETGCIVSVSPELIGTTEEWRGDLHQLSYCYHATVVEDTGKPELTELEKGEGLAHEWCTVQEALSKRREALPTSDLGLAVKERDLWLLETFMNGS